MAVVFEWNREKAALNLSKHGVAFDEAATVFGDPLARIFSDSDHSIEEEREIIIGHSSNEKLLVVSFTVRADSIRVLSARQATTKERRDYEENVIP